MSDVPSIMLDLESIRARVNALARSIGAPARYLPTYGVSEDGARPHIEAGQVYSYVVVERGRELRRERTADLDELLYWAFASVTFAMAGDHELRHRRRGEDSRRQLFAKHIELLDRLSPAWGARQAEEYLRILSRYPFVDGRG
jgi:hypothetical protein